MFPLTSQFVWWYFGWFCPDTVAESQPLLDYEMITCSDYLPVSPDFDLIICDPSSDSSGIVSCWFINSLRESCILYLNGIFNMNTTEFFCDQAKSSQIFALRSQLGDYSTRFHSPEKNVIFLKYSKQKELIEEILKCRNQLRDYRICKLDRIICGGKGYH